MSNYFYATLTIPKRFVDASEDLKAEILSEFDPNVFERAEINGGLIEFSTHSARDGVFEDLENLLVAQNIPFDRFSNVSEGVEFLERTRYFRPGEKPYDKTARSAGEEGVLMSVSDLREALQEPDDARLRQLLIQLVDDVDPQPVPLEQWAFEDTLVNNTSEGEVA